MFLEIYISVSSLKFLRLNSIEIISHIARTLLYKYNEPLINYHRSGMSGDELDLTENFIIYRENHCDSNYSGGKSFFELKGSGSNFPEGECELFAIHITENTKRILRVR